MSRKKVVVIVGCLVVLILAAAGLTTCIAGAGTDPSGYVQAQLDLTLQGETKGAAEWTGGTSSELETVYQNGIRSFVVGRLTGEGTTAERYVDSFCNVVTEMFRTSRYGVDREEKTGSGTWEVTVHYYPSDVFTRLMPQLKQTGEEIEQKAAEGAYEGTDEEIQQSMDTAYLLRAYELLCLSWQQAEYGEKETYTFTVKKSGGTLSMENEELTEFLDRIFELDKL